MFAYWVKVVAKMKDKRRTGLQTFLQSVAKLGKKLSFISRLQPSGQLYFHMQFMKLWVLILNLIVFRKNDIFFPWNIVNNKQYLQDKFFVGYTEVVKHTNNILTV